MTLQSDGRWVTSLPRLLGVTMTLTAERATGRGPETQTRGQRHSQAALAQELSHADRAALGKDARNIAPLESHSEFRPGEHRDPVGLLLGQAKSRVPDLVPVRHGRMLVSPFAYYRGAALPMAADLA